MIGTLFDLVYQIDRTHDAFHADIHGIQWVIKLEHDGKFRLINSSEGWSYLLESIQEVLELFGEAWVYDEQWQLLERSVVSL